MEITREDLTTYTQQLLTAFDNQQTVSWKRMDRIVTNGDYLMCLRMLEIIEWKDGRYHRGKRWITAGDLPEEKFIKLFSKSKRWKFIATETLVNTNPIQIGGGAPLSMQGMVNDPVILKKYLRALPARNEIVMTIKIVVSSNNVNATVQWNSSHSVDALRYANKETQQEFYKQEHITIRGKICPIIELEESVAREVSSFLDYRFPITRIRTHKKDK